MISEYHYTFEYVDEMNLVRFLTSLVIIKKRNAEDKMSQAQIASLPNAGEDAWNSFIESLGFTPPKYNDLVNGKEDTLEEIEAKMAQFRAQPQE